MQLQTLHPEIKRKVRAAFDALRIDPELGAALHDELEGYWRLPVGRWRVIYRHSVSTLDIQAVGPRATIYQELARIARRERASEAPGCRR